MLFFVGCPERMGFFKILQKIKIVSNSPVNKRVPIFRQDVNKHVKCEGKRPLEILNWNLKLKVFSKSYNFSAGISFRDNLFQPLIFTNKL